MELKLHTGGLCVWRLRHGGIWNPDTGNCL